MTAPMYPWRIQVRDFNRNRIGELDDYQQLDLDLRFNDVSTWQLTVDRRNRLARALLAPGAGIIVTRNGNTILSGMWKDADHERDADRNTVTLTGGDDTVWLQQRVAHPQPLSTAPPYSTTAEDVRTFTASNTMRQFVGVNIAVDGGTPTIPSRQVPNFGRNADVGYGATVTGRARWQNLLTLLQELATQGAVNGIPVGFRVAQLSTGVLQFQGYQPVDRTASIRFSYGLGNVSALSYKRTAPEVNYVYVGGQGDGTARTIYEKGDAASIAIWGRREGFIDAKSSATPAELDAAAVKELTDKQERNSLAVTPIDLPTMAFGVHYGLGDRVAAVLDVVGPDGANQPGDVITDLLRECKISIRPDDVTITPAIGTDGGAVAPVRMFQEIRDLKRRTNNLERR